MARIAWVSRELPDQDGQGGQRRQFHQIRALAARGHRITVIVPRSDQNGTSVRAHAAVERPPVALAGRVLRPLIGRIRRQVRLGGWDAVVVSHAESWWLMPRTGEHPPALLDVHNVFSIWHRASGRVSDAEQALRNERGPVAAADAVMTCSNAETARLIASHPAAASKTFTAPLGVDPAEWPERRFTRDEPVVAAFGSWGWAPNAEGLAWFLSEVWPSVRERVPDARFLVAGSGAESASTWPAGAEFVGRVDELSAFTAEATVVCVPVMRGVGASVKFPESLATGASVIATPDGASALQNPPAFVSDSAEQWSSWIADRLERRRDEPAPAPARGIALSEYTWDAAAEPIADWIDRVTARAEGEIL